MNPYQRYLPYLLFVISFLLLIFLGTEAPSVDSYGYAASIRDGAGLLHPHHIAYNWVNHHLYQLFQALGFSVDAIQTARLHNMFAASLGIVFCQLFFLRIGQSQLKSLLAALGLLACFGFWKMSAVVEVYVPGMTFLIALNWYMAGWKEDNFPLKNTFWTVLLLLGAIAYHQTNVLFVLPLFVFFGLKYGWNKAFSYSLKVGIPAAVLCLCMYIGAALASGYNFDSTGLSAYMFRYELSSHEEWGTFRNFAPQGWFSLLKSQVGAFIVSRYSAVALYIILYGLGIVGTLAWNIRQVMWGRLSGLGRIIRGTMLSWLAIHYLFFCWWLPQEGEFFVVSLFPLLVLLYYLLQDIKPKDKTGKVVHGFFYLLLSVQLVFLLLYVFVEKPNDLKERLQADEVVKHCPENCHSIVGDWEVEAMQYYHFREATQAGLLMLKTYELEPFLEMPDLRKELCLMVDVSLFQPGKSYRGQNGFSQGAGWWKLFSELADLKSLATGAWEARKIELLKIGELQYLKFGPETQVLKDPAYLLEEIVKDLGSDPMAGEFRQWLIEKFPIFAAGKKRLI